MAIRITVKCISLFHYLKLKSIVTINRTVTHANYYYDSLVNYV